MTRAVFTIVVSLIFSKTLAQKVLFEKEIRLRRGYTDNREAYPVKSVNDQHHSLFLIDRNSITGLLFDKNLTLVDTIEGVRPDGLYSNLVGCNISNGKYNLFFEAKFHSRLSVISFDYNSHKTNQALFELPLDKEKFAGAASCNDKFYILTVKKKSSVLTVYEFNGGKILPHTFDFKDEHFREPPFSTLFEVIKEQQFEVIDNEIPNSIDVVGKKNKLYCFDNKMVLTFDNTNSYSKVISIDLTTFDVVLKSYKKTEPECCKFETTCTNSYLYKNNIYQIFVCPQGMLFSIVALADKKSINNFDALRNDEITWRNTPMHQEGGIYNDESDLSKTKQFLRKVSAANAGICIYQSSAGLEITLGGYQEIQSGGGGGGGGMMMPGGSISTPYGPVATPAMYYPTYGGYNSYKSTRSFYFKSLLNGTSFEHIDGEISANAFDKIKKYSKGIESNITAETIIKRNGSIIFGYYDKSKRTYILQEFTD